ncbi:MAG: hydroxysqualene dehydroxylase HpnE [Phycisphaeraceae bacterium]|nr:hydroxysqualene dehydroxylase HpnE [Phycisphaeraceae bacterium]
MSVRVLILGGGIAGIAASLELCSAGARVTLIESRDRLGGRASSFFDAKSGLWLDNCQHVTLGCCEAYLRLCGLLGVSHLIRWDDHQYWVEEGGRTSVLKPAALPPPLHGLPAFARAKFLTLAEKSRIAAGLAQIRFLNRTDHEARTFADLLEDLGQHESDRLKFWDPIVISACNLTPQRVSALPAIQVFQQAFLAGARPSRIGIMTVPLGQIYDRARGAIADSGGTLLLGESVARFDGRRATLASGHTLEADAVLCALPFEKAVLLADDAIRRRDARFEGMQRMKHSPILGVHLFFDRPVLRVPHAVLVGAQTQWLFRKDEDGRKVHAVVSAADEWMGLDQDEIVGRVLRDLLARFPEAADAKLELARPVKERRATFAFTPGFEPLRPEPLAAVSESPVLAGDYTRTDWPATMEGAARSGFAAAKATLQLVRR